MNTVETGLQAGPPEKKTAKLADGNEGDTFSGPGCERESAELRRFLVIFGIIRADFSALQTGCFLWLHTAARFGSLFAMRRLGD